MNKKGIIFGILSGLILSSTAKASFIKKPYVGLSVGYARHGVDPHISGGAKPSLLHKARRFGGVPAGLHFGGELFRNNDIFTALELGADFMSSSKRVAFSEGGDDYRYKVESGFSTELALKLGFTSWGFTPYGRVGLIGTHWSQRYTQTSPVAAHNVTAKKRMFKLGWAPGGGVIFKINQKWSSGVEYKYAMYKTHKLPIQGEHIRIKPRSHTVRWRLCYSF
ncbi:MAG: outer membrane beta-barrel protein [Alphaproteobacteria bacterium]|nr:outer membrane beta-barrel protein [Alphaproteobacteria bacterium]